MVRISKETFLKGIRFTSSNFCEHSFLISAEKIKTEDQTRVLFLFLMTPERKHNNHTTNSTDWIIWYYIRAIKAPNVWLFVRVSADGCWKLQHCTVGAGVKLCICDSALYRKSDLYIPRNETARPSFKFLHSSICELFIYSQIRT
jgi:hypothetical protein